MAPVQSILPFDVNPPSRALSLFQACLHWLDCTAAPHQPVLLVLERFHPSSLDELLLLFTLLSDISVFCSTYFYKVLFVLGNQFAQWLVLSPQAQQIRQWSGLLHWDATVMWYFLVVTKMWHCGELRPMAGELPSFEGRGMAEVLSSPFLGMASWCLLSCQREHLLFEHRSMLGLRPPFHFMRRVSSLRLISVLPSSSELRVELMPTL